MIRVLLIEDEPRDATEVQAALTPMGEGIYLEPFGFLLASSLQQGIASLRENKVDVVLLDLDLPDARDFYGIDRLKREFPAIPLIVLTKQNEETLIALEAVKRGAQDYFSKKHLGEYLSLDRVIRYAIERKKVEQELVVAREAALKASRAKSEFLANMSHDIRTPLNCIIGVSDLLLRSTLSEEDKNHVKMLNRASDNLLSLINNVLDLSKIEAGQVVLANREFDLLETVGTVLDIVATRAHMKGLEVLFNITPEVPRMLMGAPDILGQVLANLLGNAVKFTKQGEVSLKVTQVATADGNTTLKFTIKDTGIGIPADKLESVFESFTQVESVDRSIKKEGSGLGLSICRRLIDLMKGKIQVRSEVGRGSEFEFELRFGLAEEATVKTSMQLLDLSGSTILVTDDNQAHGILLKELLEDWGAEVWFAKDSKTALTINQAMKSKGRRFDLGLIDLRMPGPKAGGIELAENLNGDVRTLIMMLPTNHRLGDLGLLRQVGISHYYFKPTKPEQLAEALAKALREEGASAAPQAIEKMPPVRQRPLSLLVADDSEDNRLLIQAYCKGTNIHLELVEDGRQAFEKFKSSQYDLILMDIQMPSMNGYETLAAIRDWESTNQRKQIPVLALTAFALKEEAERCLLAGFNAHVTKPITKFDLIKTINRFAS